MNDSFEKKVRSAAAAGWRVFLIAAGFVTIQWLVYLGVTHARPEWMLALWGPDVSWVFVQNVWLWVMVAFKFCVWLMGVTALWLTLWARQLRKVDRR